MPCSWPSSWSPSAREVLSRQGPARERADRAGDPGEAIHVKNKLLGLPLALALAFGPGQALALGLGSIEVKSRLSQPLVAEIPVVTSYPGEADNLIVRLASPEAFARVGLERPNALTANLKFEVVTNERGQVVVRVTTANRVNDPFVSFLIEADWGRGRLVREYTVLLDPPYMAPATRREVTPAAVDTRPAPQPVAPSVAPPPRPPEPAPREAPPATPAPSAPTAPTAPAASVPPPPPFEPRGVAPGAPTGDAWGPVQSGETLWRIAERTRRDDVSINRQMIALLRANPEAFIGGNINQLRRGAILRLPGFDEVQALSASEANALVREHMASWQASRTPVPTPAEPAPGQAAPAPTAGSAPPAPDARLQIVPPSSDTVAGGAQSGATEGGQGTELRAELAEAREELAAKDAELADLRSRLQELEEIVEQRRAVEIAQSELATLGQAAETPPPPVAEPAPAEPRRTPWYQQPWTLGGLGLLVVGLLVWLFSRRRSEPEPVPARTPTRASTLAASIDQTRSGPAWSPDAAAVEDAADKDDLVEDALDEAQAQGGEEDFEAELRQLQAQVSARLEADAALDDAIDDLARGDDALSDAREDLAGAFDAGPNARSLDEAAFAADADADASVDEAMDAPAFEAAAEDAFEAGQEDLDDAVATKLELARAYLDIGDTDGARGMLQEVIDEGGPAQQAEARRLLDEIS